MNSRLSIFNEPAEGADEDLDLSGFAPTPSHRADMEAIRRVAEPLGFVDRQGGSSPVAPPTAPAAPGAAHGQRRYRTGRNKQLSLKVTEEAQQKFYRIVDDMGWVLGDAFAQAVDALEQKLVAAGKQNQNK